MSPLTALQVEYLSLPRGTRYSIESDYNTASKQLLALGLVDYSGSDVDGYQIIRKNQRGEMALRIQKAAEGAGVL